MSFPNGVEQPNGARWALTNGRVFLPDAILEGQAVILEAGKIVGVAPQDELGADLQRVDVGGRMITPGLIDIHMHGALGRTFNEPSDEAYRVVCATLLERGITGVLATLATASISSLVACLEEGRRFMATPEGAGMLGVHVEGPYFSQEQRGAQDPAHIRDPDDGTPDQLLAHHDVIRILTLAPERPGALELIDRLNKLGIVPAAGHSSAQDHHVRAGMERGLRHMIHLWSGQSTTVREGPWRKPGILEASLGFDGLTGEIIADNRHLPYTLMRMAYKCLGPDQLCAVSDATSGAGMPQGSRFGMGGMEYEVADGVGMMLDRSAFAGSTTLLNAMVPILIDVVGIPAVQAVRMTSLTPARVIGLAERKGSIAQGKDADIAIFDEEWSAWGTVLGGQWVHRRADVETAR